jgi:hypothetical protein
VQLRQAYRKFITFEVSIKGNAVKDVQYCQATPTSVVFEVLRRGKFTKLPHSDHAELRLVALRVLINGKDFNLLQLRQAPVKLVPLEVSIKGKELKETHPNQELRKLVPFEVFIKGKELKDAHPYQAPVKSETPLILLVKLSVATICNAVHPSNEETRSVHLLVPHCTIFFTFLKSFVDSSAGILVPSSTPSNLILGKPPSTFSVIAT